jgi:hypothetical protein
MSYSYEEACDRGYDGPPPGYRNRNRYRCGGYASYDGHCGATDCDTCYPGGCDEEDEDRVEETTTRKRVIARKARSDRGGNEIRPGDTVVVFGGFSYIPGGPRVGYLPKTYLRIAKGPAWTEEA